MGTSTLKQNIRYQKADLRWHKTSYKGLTEDQKKMVKLTEQYDQLQKDLGHFWSDAPRNTNGSVNWNNYTEKELDYFDYLNKSIKRILKSIGKFEDKGIMQDEAMKMFILLNIRSASY